MPADIFEVRSARVEAEDLAVEHVGHPSKGMPIARKSFGESPTDTVSGEAGFDLRVFGDVVGVVKADECVISDWQIRGKSDGGEGKGDEKEAETRKG